MRIIKTVILISVFALSASANAATQVVSGGQLIGATGVNVSGTLYDVSFMDGTGAGLFGLGFNNGDGIIFTGSTAGEAASSALGVQVFLNTPEGDFDDIPSLINGCTHSLACLVHTPIGGLSARFVRVILGDETYSGISFGSSGNDNLTLESARTWAVWSVATVPIPAAAWLFGSALLTLAGIKRRKASI